MPDTHSIDKQKIEVSSASGVDISEVNKGLFTLRDRLDKIIDQIFNDFFPADRIVEIERITINLGTIPPTNFDQVFLNRFTEILKDELSKISEEENFGDLIAESKSVIRDSFKAFEYYLIHGYLPYRYLGVLNDLNEEFERLFQKDKKHLASIIVRLWENGIVRQRLHTSLNTENKDNLLQLLAPKKIDRLTTYEKFELVKFYLINGRVPPEEESFALFKMSNWLEKNLPRVVPELIKFLKSDPVNSTLQERLALILSINSLLLLLDFLDRSEPSVYHVRLQEITVFRHIVSQGEERRLLNSHTFKIFFLRYVLANDTDQHNKLAEFERLLYHQNVINLFSGDGLSQIMVKNIDGYKVDFNLREESYSLFILLSDKLSDRTTMTDVSIPTTSSLGYVETFIGFLSTGVLQGELPLDELVERILRKHRLLLKRLLLDKWNEYPVRFRLAYQLKQDHLPSITENLFEETDYLTWFKQVRQAISQYFAIEKDLEQNGSWGAHLYFSLFELYLSEDLSLNRHAFTDRLLLQWNELLTNRSSQEEGDEGKGGLTESIHALIMDSTNTELDHNAIGQPSYDPWKLLKILLETGAASEEFDHHFPDSEAINRVFSHVLTSPTMFREKFAVYQIHTTFWEVIIDQMSQDNLYSMFINTITLESSIVFGLANELREFQRFFSSVKSIYPISKEVMALVLRRLHEVQFSITRNELISLLFRAVFLSDSLSKIDSSLLMNERLTVSRYFSELSILASLSSDILSFKWPFLSDFLSKEIESNALSRELKILTGSVNNREKYFSDRIHALDHYLISNKFLESSVIKNESDLRNVLSALLLNKPEALIESLSKSGVKLEGLINVIDKQQAFLILHLVDAVKAQRLHDLYLDFNMLIDFGSFKHADKLALNQFILFEFLKYSLKDSESNQLKLSNAIEFLDKLATKFTLEKNLINQTLDQQKLRLQSDLMRQYVEIKKAPDIDKEDWRDVGVDPLSDYTSMDLVVYYLSHGQLPTWSRLTGTEVLSKIFRIGLDRSPKLVVDKILKAASGAQYIIRLVEILPQDTLYDILALVDNKRLPVIKEISVDLNLFYFSSAASGSSFNEFENFTNYQIAESLLITGRDKDIEAWIENILLKVSLRYSIPLSKVYGTLIQISGELRSEPMISFLNAYKKAQNIDSASLNSGIKKKYDHEYDNKDLTKYYLIYQSLPKWTSLRSEKSLKALIAKLSDQVLLELFNELKGEERAINNLTKFLSDKTVWTLIVKIDPIHGGEMKKVKEDLVSFQKNMRFFDMSPDEFVKEVSTQFLLEMVLFQVRITSMELVVGNVIQHLSKRAGNTLSQTVQVLASQSRQFKSTYLKFWLSGQPLLQEVYTEEASGYKPPPTAIDADLDREANWLLSGVRKEYQDRYDSTDIILEYLETGVIPQWSLLNTPQGLAQLIEEGLKSSPSKLGALLLNWKITDQSVERWKVLFNDTQTWEVLHILDASNTRKVKIVVEDLLAVHHSSTVWSIPRSSFKQTLVLNAVQGIIELHKSAKSIEYTIKNLLLVVVKIATYKPESIYVNLSKFFHLLNSSILKSLIQTEITSLTSTATEAGQPTFQTFNSIQNDIDLFLYLVQYKVYPWWYDQPDKTGSPKVEVYIRQLTESLSQEHLDGLLKSIYESSKPTVFLDHIISHAPRETYYRILNVLAPRVAGFANNYLMVLEEWSIKTTSKLSTDTLIKVLYYVRKVSSSFSAREFIFNVTKYLSDQSGKEVMKIMEEAELVISSRIEKGESRFVPLKEIVNNLRQTSVAGPYEIEDTYEGQAYTMPTSGNGSDFERDLTYYLVHHTLPIRAGTDYKSKDEFFAAYDSYLSKSPNNLKSLLIRELSESHMFSRLVKSQHVDFLDRILIGLSSSHYDTLKRWQSSMNLFINMIIPKIGKSTGEMISWKVLLKHLVEHGLIQMDLKTYVNKSLLALELSYYSEIFKDLSGILARIDIEKQIGKDFLSALISIVNAKPEVPKPTEVRKEESINNLESEPAIEGQISINNAGMVIFASFLPRYFEVLNMVENGRFKNEDLSSRAVLLVQYLTTGIAKAPEHELILNKVLCGVAINVPVEAEIQLTDQEEELSESLLSGVRQNWGKLEGSSNDGLRQGFLMRGGQLWETDGSFKLKVEKKTMDILLDYMPWSFKLTKLSWMKKPLEVEWL